MAFNLAALLQSVGGGVPEASVDPLTGDIIANGARSTAPVAPPPTSVETSPVPVQNVTMVDRAAPTREQMQEVVPREGLFGVKGTLRDVLGLIGDSFLVQAGQDRIYDPARRQERFGDAMYGYASGNTREQRAALERAALVDPAAAAELTQQFMQNEQNALEEERLSRAAQAKTEEERNDRLANLRDLAARGLGNPNLSEEQQAYMYSILQKEADRLGVDLEEIGITEGMSAEQREVLGNIDMRVNQIRNLPLAEGRLDVARGNLRNNTRRTDAYVNKPAPRGRANTRNEDYLAASAIPASQRTPAQQAIVDAGPVGTPTNRRRTAPARGAGRTAPSAGSSDNPRFRGWSSTRSQPNNN